ncbi:MAG: helix-turn-helix domain-containing protein [Alphaproteobacteria bacterium]|nr:helix-turn-helix domain-containing protein [Alphaproteobacteria bacterium]MBU2306731.1 helix-turn-helix domain-containing protein [Alphaproteobacteria bacterium]
MLNPLLIDTATVEPSEQYAWYTDQLEQVFGIRSEPVLTRAGRYNARIDVLASSPLTYMTFRAENNGGVRLRRQISQVEWGHYCVYRELGNGILFDLAGREFTTSRGDLVVYDGDATMRSRAKASFNHAIWMLPRATLDPHLPLLPRPLVVHIPATLGLTGLAIAYLDALAAPIGDLSDEQAGLVADNLARLIAIACGAASRPHGEAIRTAKLDQIRQYVRAHLTLPGLDPEMAAGGLGMSVRQLHLLFEPTGETFGQYVRRLRLRHCRLALESPLTRQRSVADIAFSCGFASLPTFYRAFQAEFGLAPGDLRPAA